MMINVSGRRCVIVGGGSVAARRARSLREAGAEVIVIAPSISVKLRGLGCELIERGYATGDVANAWLVVIASDDPRVNQRVADDAAKAGAMINRADDPEAGDVIVPAVGRADPITVAVHTSGISAAAAGRIRDELLESLDPFWPTLLRHAGEFRRIIQARITDADQRQRRLRALTDRRARHILESQGESALRCYHERLSDPDQPLPSEAPEID